MAIIKWREAYNTGVEQIDQEHQKIIELIEIMHCVIRDKGGNEEIQRVLEEVIDYTQVHFIHEEEYMASKNYPHLEDHKIEHQQLIEDVGEFKKLLDNDSSEGIQEFYKFLREWLINHILDSDKKIGEFIADKK